MRRKRFRLRLLALLCLAAVLAGCSSSPAPATVAATPQATTDLAAAPAPQPTPCTLAAKREFRTKMMTAYLARLPELDTTIAADELAAGEAFRIDVREPAEYAQGFIEGSVNIPLRDLTSRLDALPGLDQPIVVTCDTGHRSAIAMATLQILGYRDVRSLQGGLDAWQAAALPLVTEPVPDITPGTAPDVNADYLATLDEYLRESLSQSYGTASPQDLANAIAEAFLALPPTLVDVRAPELYAGGHISGSVNIELTGLLGRLKEIPFTQDIRR